MCILTGGNELILVPPATALIFNSKNWGATKERLNPCVAQVQNEEPDRHRVKIQTHTQNKEQMLRRASQVIFAKKIYIKHNFILENIVEWAILLKYLQVRCNSEA